MQREIYNLEAKIKSIGELMAENNNISSDELNNLNKKIESLSESLSELEDRFGNELSRQSEIIESQQDILNIILSNKNLRAHGTLRNVQLHTFEILKFIVNICNKYDLDYWLDFGSLVGALRHEGFVPWDDEADISMPREDYEKFIKVIHEELEKFPDIKERISVSMGVSVFRNVKLANKFPSPACQIIDHKPLANVDIYPIDYYSLTKEEAKNASLNEYMEEFSKVRRRLQKGMEEGVYDCFEDALISEGKKIKISKAKTGYFGSCLDGAGRKPMHVTNLYPLKKANFNGVEFNIPRKPIHYLNGHYEGEIMKIPMVIHHHKRKEYVERQYRKGNLDEAFEQTIAMWRYANSYFE